MARRIAGRVHATAPWGRRAPVAGTPGCWSNSCPTIRRWFRAKCGRHWREPAAAPSALWRRPADPETAATCACEHARAWCCWTSLAIALGAVCADTPRALPIHPVDRIDLEHGLLLLSAYLSPGIDLRTYRRALDALGEGLRKRVSKSEAGIGRALLVGHYLGTELGYRGDREDYHHPENLSLARAIERKRGLPLTLAALYRSVARRAGLRAEILPLPGHVLVRIEEGVARPILDPFDGGRPLAEADCRSYIARHGIPWNRKWLEPAQPGLILQRQVANTRRSAQERGWSREVRRLTQLHAALAARLRAPASRTS